MKIEVNASKKYSVFVEDNLNLLKSAVSDVLMGEKVLILTDSNVATLYGDVIKKQIKNKTVYTYVIHAGEESKNAKNYLDVLNFLAINEFSRKDTLIAFGGGVVGDLGGFIASTYMRGINFINVPTTLLSMVDSSIGGKTAINLESGKNLAGTFYQPSLVYVSVDFLNTLPKRELLSGLGEVCKYLFIDKLLQPNDLEKIDKTTLAKCIEIKRKIVESDEKESGIRKILNLGHTVGHAIEKASGFSLSHGECILKGIKIALDLSLKLGTISKQNYSVALNILSPFEKYLDNCYSKDELITYLKVDKKKSSDEIDFVLINDKLLCQIVSLKIQTIYELL